MVNVRKTALLCCGMLTMGMASGGYNDLGPYVNTEYNDFWDLRGHAEVEISSGAAVCSSATFDPQSFARAYAEGCDVYFTKPGFVIFVR